MDNCVYIRLSSVANKDPSYNLNSENLNFKKAHNPEYDTYYHLTWDTPDPITAPMYNSGPSGPTKKPAARIYLYIISNNQAMKHVFPHPASSRPLLIHLLLLRSATA